MIPRIDDLASATMQAVALIGVLMVSAIALYVIFKATRDNRWPWQRDKDNINRFW